MSDTATVEADTAVVVSDTATVSDTAAAEDTAAARLVPAAVADLYKSQSDNYAATDLPGCRYLSVEASADICQIHHI